MKNLFVICTLALLAIVTTVPVAEAAALHGRVSSESGSALVRGERDDDWSYATLNTLILEGDTLWVDDSGTLEVELPDGAFLRLADGSRAEVAGLSPEIEVRGWTGSFYLQRVSRSGTGFRFVTPACTIEASQDSMIRVDIVADGATTVSARWGMATVRTDVGRPVVLTKGKRTFVDPGYLPAVPIYFDRTAEDAFDVWNRERGTLLALGENALQSSSSISSAPEGAYDLAAYGDWVYIDSEPYWRPTTVRGYVPYRHGHWSYVPAYGYVWVGSYPFSYVTSHYGRWRHHDEYGWVWCYRDQWAPAWAMTARCGSNFIWAPLDPFDRPVTIGVGYYEIGGLRISISASSYCRVDDLLYGPAVTYACKPDIVRPAYVNGDVYIWNITVNQGDSPNSRINFRRPIHSERDYSPRRVIRGPESAGKSGITARHRAVTLENKVDQKTFERVKLTGNRSLRTPVSASSREATVRPSRIDKQATLNTSATVNRLQRATAPAGQTTRSNDGSSRLQPFSGVVDKQGQTALRDRRSLSGSTSDTVGQDGSIRAAEPYRWTARPSTSQAPTVTRNDAASTRMQRTPVPQVTTRAPEVTTHVPDVRNRAPEVTQQVPQVTSRVPQVTSRTSTPQRIERTQVSTPMVTKTPDFRQRSTRTVTPDTTSRSLNRQTDSSSSPKLYQPHNPSGGNATQVHPKSPATRVDTRTAPVTSSRSPSTSSTQQSDSGRTTGSSGFSRARSR